MLSKHQLVKFGIIRPGANKWYLGDGGNFIVTSEGTVRPITFWELPLFQKFSWIWLCLWNHFQNEAYFAKAGWANTLAVLNIAMTDKLIQEYDDADKIPSGVDVPVQRIRLSHLSLLCYMINIKRIEIKIEEGSIEAHNSFVKVSTQPIPGFGQAVVIDGDFGSLQDKIRPIDTSTTRCLCFLARGDLLGLAGFRGDIEYLDTDAFLYGLLRKWDQDTWVLHEVASKSHRFINTSDPKIYAREHLRVSPRLQAAYYSKILQDPQNSKSWSDIWKDGMGSCTPTILGYLGVMPFISIWCAAPLSLFFTPYTAHLQENRKIWWQTQKDNDGLRFLQHPQMEIDLAYGSIPFLKENSDYQMIINPIQSVADRFSWVAFPVINVLRRWSSDISKGAIEDLDGRVFVFPTSVIRLLEGDSVQDVRRIMKETMPLGENFGFRLESTLLLSLLMVDCRLQALWVILDPDGSLGRFYKAVKTQGIEPTDYGALGALIENARLSFGLGVDGIDSTLVHFTTLWFELGRRADLTGEESRLQNCFTEIVNEWQDDDGDCIPALPPLDLSAQSNFIKSGNIADYAKKLQPSPDEITKKKFVQWLRTDVPPGDIGSSSRPRIDIIRTMIPLLQLRTFLMALSYDCYADSSQVYLTDSEATVDVRLI
ncbi:hypothetical protein Dda_5010 [Drechslerella dactyloides]|uniref:Uncharacterized protein n=1 Tax=Drechslerella dactyloides TaxID=74499 RepID=A0AAD6IYE9_DREDA|nr:hypothetical protein Dda_5010 [Drechslerella dactyloides]